MRRLLSILWIMLFMACNGTREAKENGLGGPAADNSRNAVDWPGTYRGTLPCADCIGIQTSLSLSQNGNYRYEAMYLGKSDSVHVRNGVFTWSADGKRVMLGEGADSAGQQYLVGENVLYGLDREGNRLASNAGEPYILSKAANDLLNVRWQLTELNGQPVDTSALSKKEAYIRFSADTRFAALAGCNNLAGSFSTTGIDRIRFSKVIATRMACPDMKTETEFIHVLETADNYQITGGQLILNKAKMAPLARLRSLQP